MRLLLDTNVLVPIARRKAATLPPAVLAVIEAPATRMFMSIASLWEMTIKFRLGKLPLPGPVHALPDAYATFGIEMLPVIDRHVLEELNPPIATRDPFDRLLLAVCAVEGIRLVTTDRVLQDHPLAWRAG